MVHKAKTLTILYNYLLSMKAAAEGEFYILNHKKVPHPAFRKQFSQIKPHFLERKGQKDTVFQFRLE